MMNFVTYIFVSNFESNSNLRIYFEGVHIRTVSSKIQIIAILEDFDPKNKLANEMKAKNYLLIAIDLLSYVTKDLFEMEQFTDKSIGFEKMKIPMRMSFRYEGINHIEEFRRLNEEVIKLEGQKKIQYLQKMRMYRYRL